MTHAFRRRRRLWALMGATGLLGSLLIPMGAQAMPWGYQSGSSVRTVPYGTRAVPAPLDHRPAHRGSGTYYDYDPSLQPRSALPIGPAERQLTYEEVAQRCNIGRLVGGLVGGSVGYGVSRGDGRTWAVPLGALLGTQVGCNVGAGRPPLPW